MSKNYTPFDYAKASKTAERIRTFYNTQKKGVHIHIKSCDSLALPERAPLNS